MFVARMAQLGRSCRGSIPLHHGDRYARKTLEPLTIGERDGNMPQDRLTPPARRGPSAPSACNRSRQVSHPGAYRSYRAFGSFKIGAAPAVYHSAGLAPGLSSLSSLCSHISANAARSEGASGQALQRDGPALSGSVLVGCVAQCRSGELREDGLERLRVRLVYLSVTG
jgi:hypothetical protein